MYEPIIKPGQWRVERYTIPSTKEDEWMVMAVDVDGREFIETLKISRYEYVSRPVTAVLRLADAIGMVRKQSSVDIPPLEKFPDIFVDRAIEERSGWQS